MNPAIVTAMLVLDELTDDELITLNLVGALDGDPRPTICWPKAKPLFTENQNGVPRMHSVTKDAVSLAVSMRL